MLRRLIVVFGTAAFLAFMVAFTVRAIDPSIVKTLRPFVCSKPLSAMATGDSPIGTSTTPPGAQYVCYRPGTSPNASLILGPNPELKPVGLGTVLLGLFVESFVVFSVIGGVVVGIGAIRRR